MLTCTVDLTKIRDVQRWLGFVVLALPILTNQSPEEAILARLEELGKMWLNLEFCPLFQKFARNNYPSTFHVRFTNYWSVI